MGTDTQVELQLKTIFFDGVCNLCNSSVNFVIDRDQRKQFTFASLQSAYAEKVFAGTEIDPGKLEGIIFKKGDEIFRKSDAALEIAKEMGGMWSLLFILKIFPRFFRDWIYDLIARKRYRWFGKRDTCRLPTPELQERFLDS